jgi:hypothetical protein
MRQERTIQATIFEVFAQHEIGCELEAMSQWLDSQHQLTSLVADDLRRQGGGETGRHGLAAESMLRCALLKPSSREPSIITIASQYAGPRDARFAVPGCGWADGLQSRHRRSRAAHGR